MNEMNFCPGCGQPLQPDTNFCPKCGRNLSSEAQPKQKGFSLSKLKDSKIGASVAGAASGVVSKIKSNVNAYKQWDGELIRTRPLLLPEDTPDTPVFKGRGFGSMAGKATSPKYGRLVLTRKSILFYDVPTAKTFLPGKHVADKLEFTVNLADIESFKKETNKLGMTGYSMMVRGAYCDIDFCKDPSKFILYITKLAGLDGNLLNIKLREGEKVIDTGNISVKTGGFATINTGGWQYATMYLTNQRIVINKSSNEMIEGGDMIFEKDRSAIDEITEEKNAMNCVYTIKGYGEPITLKFSGLVPGWFLGLVKNGEGNAKQLKRKSNLMKGAKVAMIAASVLGAAGDADAETDVDADADYDMDGDMVDMDGDGIDDAMLVDTDGDGVFDTMAVDVDGDGTFDAIGVDTDGDGAIDTMAVDADGDGALDTMAVDIDGDGSIDAMGMDTNGDGAIDTVVIDDNVSSPEYTAVDVDGDGTIDAVGVDTDSDGVIDSVAVDTDGDGSFDAVMVDVDGDGAIDAVGIDTDGDGAIDTVSVDTDGDGSLDSIGIDTDGDGTIDTIGVDTDGDGRIDAVGVDMDGNGTIDKVGIDTDGNGTIDTITNVDHSVGDQSPTGMVEDVPSGNSPFASIAAGAAVVAGAVNTAKAKAQDKQPKDYASSKNKVATSPSPPAQDPTQQLLEKYKKKSKIGWIIGIAALILAVAAIIGFLMMKNKEDASVIPLEKLSSETKSVETKPVAMVYSKASDGFVNIRQAPESNAPIMGVLRNGPNGAMLLGTEGEWKKIDYNGIVGYVYEKYVQDTPTEVIEYWGMLRKDASTYRFTENDLSPLTARELTYLRNSVYAKHGYVFNSQELNDYFKRISWYHPDASVTDEALNSLERENVEFIKNYQERNGKTYIPNDATKGIFSVGYSQQVYFAKGNLQYQASSGRWRFANNQWETMGKANINNSANNNGWIDLFGWGTGNDPFNHSENNNDYATFCDWGSYGIGDGWRTPTIEEWHYLFTGRSDAYNKYGAALVNGVVGLVVLPDDWVAPSGLSFNHSLNYSQNTYDAASWSRMEEAGAIFLPAAGRRTGEGLYNYGNDCDYWSSTPNGNTKAYNIDLTKGKNLIPQDESPRKHGFAVRLIKNKNGSSSNIVENSYERKTVVSEDNSWIVGTWACDMGSYGTVVVEFKGNGSSGDCVEAQYGSYSNGTYYVSGNTLHYKLNGESVTTTIEIEPGHRLSAGGGYYFHKRSSMASSDGGNSYSNSFRGNESSSSNYSSSSSKSTTTFSYQSDIMAYLRSHRFVASNGDGLTFTNSGISNGSAMIGVTNYEVVGWDSETALLSAHTPYGTPPIDIYIYAAEGHIVIDNVMYFAK